MTKTNWKRWRMSQLDSYKPDGKAVWITKAVKKLRYFPPRLITAVFCSFRKAPMSTKSLQPFERNETRGNTKKAPQPSIFGQKMLALQSLLRSMKTRDQEIHMLTTAILGNFWKGPMSTESPQSPKRDETNEDTTNEPQPGIFHQKMRDLRSLFREIRDEEIFKLITAIFGCSWKTEHCLRPPNENVRHPGILRQKVLDLQFLLHTMKTRDEGRPKTIMAIFGSFRKKSMFNENPVGPPELDGAEGAAPPCFVHRKLLELRLLFASIKERDERIHLLEQEAHAVALIEYRRFLRRRNTDARMDDDNRRDLLGLRLKMAAWIHKYCSPALEKLDDLPTIEKNAIIKQLEGYCIQITWEELCDKIPPGMAKWIPSLLLEAALAKLIYSEVLAHPLMVLCEDKGDPLSFAAVSQCIYEDLLKEDISRASVWRSEVFRTLQRSQEESKSSNHNYFIQERMKEACNVRCTEFMNSPARHLLKPSDLGNEEFQEDLADVLLHAAKLSFSLGTQRRNLKCYDLDNICLFKQHEDYDRRDLTYHPFVKGKYIGSPEYLVLTQPLVRAHGDEHDANNYDRSIAWNSAEVYIDATRPD